MDVFLTKPVERIAADAAGEGRQEGGTGRPAVVLSFAVAGVVALLALRA